jgi:N-acetylglucosaminyldiphosphoundecaprenol N-acetyl-beta-D-mannosaminyltransferase
MAIPDGIGLMMAARLAGRGFRQHVRGTDLVHRAAALCARKGYRVFLLGAAPGVAEEAAARLVKENPGLQIAGCHAGSSRPEDDEQTASAVAEAGRVDLILVAYGAGAQEC